MRPTRRSPLLSVAIRRFSQANERERVEDKITENHITQPKHSPDGKKRGSANVASLGGPLVMQVVALRDREESKMHQVFRLRDAVWVFDNAEAPILRWVRERVQMWVPRLTGAAVRLADSPGATVSIIVGSPESNHVISNAVGQGLLDLATLGEEDFFLKQAVLGGSPVLLIAGRSPRAAVYGVCELFERLGCTFLISDDHFPECNPELALPVLDEVQRTDCSWRGIWFGGYCFVANSMFSLSDYEAMFDQMIKLKMNRIIFYHFPNEPFIDYTFQGLRFGSTQRTVFFPRRKNMAPTA